ncbi:MAG: DUF4123 domain-containing protein [Acidobacteria bacterium]|nr:DUF4123 domain-containing protein [Acidobacteriota bacterium]
MSIYEQVRGYFWPKGSRPDMWMIVDCGRDKRLYSALSYSGLEHECLFAGSLSIPLQRASPYLVRLELDDKSTIRLIEDGFGNSWGSFIRADVGIKTLRKHLRTMLRVQAPNGKYMLFRYWDPRVLRIYLPTCMPDEVHRFFGPMEQLWMEDAPLKNRFLRFIDRNGRLERLEVEIEEAPAEVE